MNCKNLNYFLIDISNTPTTVECFPEIQEVIDTLPKLRKYEYRFNQESLFKETFPYPDHRFKKDMEYGTFCSYLLKEEFSAKL